MSAASPRRRPVSSYRLQLGQGVGFREAARLVPFLADLGITECYCSPILEARSGSLHGYDVCDHGRLSGELGGAEGFAELAEAARAREMGLLVDFVPNHMAADASANPWWRNLLENGPSSPYASYFDVDWDPVKPELKGRLLLPILGDQYGVTLEDGCLRLVLDSGAIRLFYFEHDLPLNPRQLRIVLEHDLAALAQALPQGDPDLTEYESILFHLQHLPAYTTTDLELVGARQREMHVALGRLQTLMDRSPLVRIHLERNVGAFNGTPGEPASFDLLHRLLEAQPYRLASWRTAMHEINYRRFFDVNELAGIRQEEPAVFEASHRLLARLVVDGAITGVRLDHVDGLFEPGAYLAALAEALREAGPVWTLVEKILSPGERLNPAWPVHGTTGYEFLNQLTAVLVDPAGVAALGRFFARFTDRDQAFADVVYASKKVIIATSMAAELNVLAAALNRISESDRRSRDFTLDSLQEALEEVVACFPVYRTYVRPGGWTAADQAVVDQAIAAALHRNPALEPTIFGFIRAMLLPTPEAAPDPEERDRRERFAMKFQQYTAPVQAKGVEDTAFYRSAPLAALNEVGGGPAVPADPVAAFHAANLDRGCHWPLALLATATHDTKWGEDARARLSVLSEIPRRWQGLVTRWHRVTREARGEVDGRPVPEPADEYLFYQALLGIWPPDQAGPPGEVLVQRLQGFMQKAMREAKLHTSWLNPRVAYETALQEFVAGVLVGRCAPEFLRSFAPVARWLAWLGMLNSVSQVVLKAVSPGVPDLYQGTELWDLGLVDPDNRRPVDFEQRRALLEQLRPLLDRPGDPGAGALLAPHLLREWPDGRIKLLVTALVLRLRRRLSTLFLDGEYRPLTPTGPGAAHLVALARVQGPAGVLAVVPRLPAKLVGWERGEQAPVGPVAWGETAVPLPDELAARSWRNALTGGTLRAEAGGLMAASALAELPWGVFVTENGG
jgi:(1->4)-alpha-D-glucan 1-alpha-D-glucosylmutase